MTDDFTAGSIPRTLARFSLPILLANLLQSLMQLINGLWVGNLLGSEAFAAVTVATTMLMVVLAFVLGMNNATLTIFAQLRGARDEAGIGRFLGAFGVLLVGLSVAIGVAGYLLAESLLLLLNTPASILRPATTYLRINFIGTLFLVGYNFIGTLLRAFGDSRTPLYFVLLATVLAGVLGPLFIAVVDLGVAGAAWAMVLAQGIAFVYSLIYLRRRPGRYPLSPRRPAARDFRTIFELGIPSGVQMIVIYAGSAVILSLVNSFGDGVVAGFGAAQRLDSIHGPRPGTEHHLALDPARAPRLRAGVGPGGAGDRPRNRGELPAEQPLFGGVLPVGWVAEEGAVRGQSGRSDARICLRASCSAGRRERAKSSWTRASTSTPAAARSAPSGVSSARTLRRSSGSSVLRTSPSVSSRSTSVVMLDGTQRRPSARARSDRGSSDCSNWWSASSFARDSPTSFRALSSRSCCAWATSRSSGRSGPARESPPGSLVCLGERFIYVLISACWR